LGGSADTADRAAKSEQDKAIDTTTKKGRFNNDVTEILLEKMASTQAVGGIRDF
jgi:hypothetical protein